MFDKFKKFGKKILDTGSKAIDKSIEVVKKGSEKVAVALGFAIAGVGAQNANAAVTYDSGTGLSGSIDMSLFDSAYGMVIGTSVIITLALVVLKLFKRI